MKGVSRDPLRAVDLVKMDEGWAVMELEMVEPSLFLAYDERAPRRLADALRERLV